MGYDITKPIFRRNCSINARTFVPVIGEEGPGNQPARAEVQRGSGQGSCKPGRLVGYMAVVRHGRVDQIAPDKHPRHFETYCVRRLHPTPHLRPEAFSPWDYIRWGPYIVALHHCSPHLKAYVHVHILDLVKNGSYTPLGAPMHPPILLTHNLTLLLRLSWLHTHHTTPSLMPHKCDMAGSVSVWCDVSV